MTRPKPPHGTISRYTNQRCRCDDCRAAFAAYQRHRRARLRANPVPPHVSHGSVSTAMNYRCGCRPCRNAVNAYHRAWRARRKQEASA
jgi:hypothetical protein